MASCGVPPHTPDILRLLLHFLSVPRHKQLLNIHENNKIRFYKVPRCKISGFFWRQIKVFRQLLKRNLANKAVSMVTILKRRGGLATRVESPPQTPKNQNHPKRLTNKLMTISSKCSFLGFQATFSSFGILDRCACGWV